MYKRKALSIEVKEVIKMLMATLCGLLLIGSAYFFAKTSTGAEQGYLLKENQTRQEKLEYDLRMLEQQVLESQSIKKLEKSDTVKDMIPPQNPVFIKPKTPLSRKK